MSLNAWNLPRKSLTKLFFLQNLTFHVIKDNKGFFSLFFFIASTVYNTGGKECPELLPALFHEVWQNEALVDTDFVLKE